MQLFFDHIGEFGPAVLMTLALTVVGFAGSMVIGSVTAIFRVSPIAPMRAAGALYVEVFRNMPLLSLLIIMVFGLPDIGVRLSLFWSMAVSMMLVGGAFAGEAIRSGINAVPVGNAEAARSIGLTFTQSLAFVIMPQALASMVQPLTNVLIGQLLGSSLAAAVNVDEITYRAQFLNLQYAGGLALFVPAAVIYIVLALLTGQGGGWLERRLMVHR
ncbi:glutamate transport system permease protein [Friedmanniella endophytica]|uniref:Glutamate transport system permease protein n=1 Tax=Microlunatus kandeliicorticis TaxID=1759536 RepID=A0A7W3P7C1_9ACTN|nr:amino acid ABC transporter permease [Microlunatus kandeliicorticis]MBA8795822.1 glutamate transport system permease protein [Microlunatus kandeliicorticis]